VSYRALKGVTVLDLGIITAGASTSTILADLGAEVIKIEGPRYIDPFRYWFDEGTDGKWWDASPPFILTNRGKRSVCIDLKSDEGRALFLDLVRDADVVVENFRVGVLDTLGIPYATLRRANEKIVLISISSQGQTGPDAKAVSFGSTLEASSGMASLIRYPDGGPQISGHALNYPDQVVSLFAAGAVMCALAQRKNNSCGCHIDLSQRELASFMLGDYLMAALDGNPSAVPPTSGVQVVAATGDGRWIAVHFQSVDGARRFTGST
jgi:benzylsuccinate CoA-transferase BbsF subunit